MQHCLETICQGLLSIFIMRFFFNLDLLRKVLSRSWCICIFVKVNGEWGDWSAWSSCSTSCGGGTKMRSRDCDNPAPSHGGKACLGESTENNTCANTSCPGSLLQLSVQCINADISKMK